MKKIFLSFLMLLFSCASQGSPSGGPVDKEGPIILKFSSEQKINQNEAITISFDEIIKPSSAIQSITINGEKDFKMQIRYNKVIIRPIGDWPNIVELNIGRNIEDYQGNIMDSPVSKIFTIGMIEIPKGIINGELINFYDELYEIGLYETKEDSLFFIKKTQANKKGEFKFQNIGNGKYRLCAIEGVLNDFNKNYRFNRYGLQSKQILISPSNYNININIMIDDPISKNEVVAAEMINSNYGILTLTDGSEKSIYLKSNRESEKYLDGDSISIKIDDENRFGKYLMEPFDFSARIGQDTISANLDKYYIDDNMLFLKFSEPVKLLKDDIFFNNDSTFLAYDIVDPFTFSLILEDSIDVIKIAGNYISDFNNNLSDSLIRVNVPSLDENLEQKFGSLKGKVNYNEIDNIVVRLSAFNSNNQYHTLINEDSTFIFDKVLPGIYTLDSYENKLSDLKIYYSGEWDPFNYAAKFATYPEYIDIRAHWVIEGVEINYD